MITSKTIISKATIKERLWKGLTEVWISHQLDSILWTSMTFKLINKKSSWSNHSKRGRSGSVHQLWGSKIVKNLALMLMLLMMPQKICKTMFKTKIGRLMFKSSLWKIKSSKGSVRVSCPNKPVLKIKKKIIEMLVTILNLNGSKIHSMLDTWTLI